jgi:hypothetical protein
VRRLAGATGVERGDYDPPEESEREREERIDAEEVERWIAWVEMVALSTEEVLDATE